MSSNQIDPNAVNDNVMYVEYVTNSNLIINSFQPNSIETRAKIRAISRFKEFRVKLAAFDYNGSSVMSITKEN